MMSGAPLAAPPMPPSKTMTLDSQRDHPNNNTIIAGPRSNLILQERSLGMGNNPSQSQLYQLVTEIKQK